MLTNTVENDLRGEFPAARRATLRKDGEGAPDDREVLRWAIVQGEVVDRGVRGTSLSRVSGYPPTSVGPGGRGSGGGSDGSGLTAVGRGTSHLGSTLTTPGLL